MTSPSPRLAPVTSATRFDVSMRHLLREDPWRSTRHQTSSALEVKRKVLRHWRTDGAKRHDDRRGGQSGAAWRPSALRFYEDQRLIHSERNDSGHRRYSARRDPPGGVHRVRAEGRAVARRDSRRAGEAAAAIACPSGPTGRSCRRAGRSGFASASPSSSGSRRASPSASAAAACRWTAAALANPGDRAARRGSGSALLDGRMTRVAARSRGADSE